MVNHLSISKLDELPQNNPTTFTGKHPSFARNKKIIPPSLKESIPVVSKPLQALKSFDLTKKYITIEH